MASFEIVEFVDGKPRAFPAGVFPDGASAASIIKSLSAKYPGKKFQPRPLTDPTRNWKVREQTRFDEGLYEPLGLKSFTPIADHFAHKALKTPSNVAYTPDSNHGQVDKQLSVHIRKYLAQFYPGLSIEERRRLIWEYCGEDVSDGLTITQDADEIENVYTNGPHSCMAYGRGNYDGAFHPARCYAGPDLAIAYLKDNDRVVARTVVWPAKKIFSRTIYGDSVKLRAGLIEMGYTQAEYGSAWYGARLTTEPSGDDYTCPYLDIAGYVEYDGKYLVLVEYSDIGGQSDCGTTYPRESDNYDDDY